MNIYEAREKVIEDKIREKENCFCGKKIEINTTDLLIEIMGEEKVTVPYMIIASHIFKRRGWVQRRKLGEKRKWVYFRVNNDLTNIW